MRTTVYVYSSLHCAPVHDRNATSRTMRVSVNRPRSRDDTVYLSASGYDDLQNLQTVLCPVHCSWSSSVQCTRSVSALQDVFSLSFKYTDNLQL